MPPATGPGEYYDHYAEQEPEPPFQINREVPPLRSMLRRVNPSFEVEEPSPAISPNTPFVEYLMRLRANAIELNMIHMGNLRDELLQKIPELLAQEKVLCTADLATCKSCFICEEKFRVEEEVPDVDHGCLQRNNSKLAA